MFLKVVLFFVLGLLLMSSISCREVQNYRYNYTEFELFEGILGVNLVGRYGENYEEDGKKLLDYGFPYNLQFTYAIPPDSELYAVTIQNIKLVSKETGASFNVLDVTSKKVRTYDTRKLVRISTGPLTSDQYNYEDYYLNADVLIYKNADHPQEESISVLLKTDYKKEIRNDWFDEKTGV